MEKNKFQKLTGSDLDKLINQSFLNLDFDQPLNQKLMESISNRALTKTNLFPSFDKVIFNKLALIILACVLADGLIPYLKREDSQKVAAIYQLPQKKADDKTVNIKMLFKQPKANPLEQIPTKKTGTKTALLEKSEKIILSGTIQSAKTTEHLKGAAVYKLNSDINVISTDEGYYSLQLPIGENVIAVSLLGYQTFTFSVYSNEDMKRNIELREVSKALDEIVVKQDDYIFPILTEKEKRANEKEKQKMAKLASKLRPGRDLKYSSIPGSADKKFLAFYMGSGEVTNLEYRTFLFDLLIKGRKEEFLVAKPEQDLWINAAGVHFFDTLSRIYFSEKKYNSYPVVNISVEGAEMYCRWLGQLVNEIRQKENKTTIELRLPYEKEWRYAASAGNPDAVYAWPLDSVQNHFNWFLANCCIQKQSDKFKYPFNKTIKYPLGYPGKSDSKAYTSAGMATGNHKTATAETWSYNPNGFNLYDVCGNVSEMVYVNDGKKLKAKGGNWNSDFEHLKFNNDNEFDYNVNPSPMIGFRVCMFEKK